jgi:hypothetical protein
MYGVAQRVRVAPSLIYPTFRGRRLVRTNQRHTLHSQRLRWIGLGVMMGLLLLVGRPVANAQEQAAVVRIDPGVIEVGPGQAVMVTVVLADAQDVYAIDVRAAFDPQLVEVVDADPAREGVQFSPGTFPRPDFLVRNEADNQAGTLHYAITQVNPTEPVNGNGVAFSVQLRAKAASGEGRFTISAVELTDRDGVLLAVQPESSLIRVIPGGQVEPTAAPPAAPTATSPATAIPPSSSPTVPPPAPATQAAPAVPAAAPTLSSSPEPAVAAPPADTPASAPLAPEPASTPADSSTSGAAEPAAATPQAVAAAPTSQTVAPANTLPALQPGAPAESSAAGPAVTPAGSGQPEEAAPPALLQRPTGAAETSAQSSPAVDPSRLLLIVGIVALSAAGLLAMLLVVVLRR